MKLRLYFILFCLFSLIQNTLFAQENTVIDTLSIKKYQFDIQLWENYSYQAFNDEFKSHGLNNNPGISQSDYFKILDCETCDKNDILQVSFQGLQSREENLFATVIIFEFKDSASLMQTLPSLTVIDEEIWMYQGKFLINIWNQEEDENTRNDYLKNAQQFYEKIGAKKVDAPLKNIEITEEEFENLLKENQGEENKTIANNKNKKIKHLFASESAFIVFYNDGTVSVCPDCALNEKNILALAQESPYSIYLESNTGVAIQSKEKDMDGPVILDFNSSADMGKWIIKDFKTLSKIPQ
ncbi:MAG: hypothetical protein E6Q89_00750 [Bacteroidia bacterium]|nr:MAG: hypothetical protein E6Q89_00750 [Bacteroidia bacterium]